MMISKKKMMQSKSLLVFISISSIMSILCILCYLSLESELESLRQETRLLQDHVKKLAPGGQLLSSSSLFVPLQEKLISSSNDREMSGDTGYGVHPEVQANNKILHEKRTGDQSLQFNDEDNNLIINTNAVVNNKNNIPQEDRQQLQGIYSNEDASDEWKKALPASSSPSSMKSAVESSDSTVIFYNRVPKTGSTTFVGIAYEVCKDNAFHVIHVNTSRNSHILSLDDQERFVSNISNWNERKPGLYHGHISFIDFKKFGSKQDVIYINMLRDPIQRLVSYYYFLRFGDDFRPYVNRKRKGNKVSFDDCVRRKEHDCDPLNMWLQIPFFCGHSFKCWIPGSEWALNQAKNNLVNHYLLVGITEEMYDFFALLEVVLPKFFAGSTKLYEEGSKSHLRKTYNKLPPSQETLDILRQSKIWMMEQEFYDFAKSQFHFMKRLTFGSSSASGSSSSDNNVNVADETKQVNMNLVRGPKFFYDKLRPKYT